MAACLTAALLPLPAHAAGTTHSVSNSEELLQAVMNAGPGDVIQLSQSFGLQASSGKEDPWIIDKNVIIRGSQGIELSLRRSGIILGADVVFEDIAFNFTTSTRNAIIANGHTLTLNNVKTADNAYSFNLFCGGLLTNSYESFDLPETGNDGQIIINGKTNLQGSSNACGDGNIYAGNLCMGNMGGEGATDDSGPNQFNGNASITINADKDSNLGSIYACGAKQYAPASLASGQMQTLVNILSPAPLPSPVITGFPMWRAAAPAPQTWCTEAMAIRRKVPLQVFQVCR